MPLSAPRIEHSSHIFNLPYIRLKVAKYEIRCRDSHMKIEKKPARRRCRYRHLILETTLTYSTCNLSARNWLSMKSGAITGHRQKKTRKHQEGGAVTGTSDYTLHSHIPPAKYLPKIGSIWNQALMLATDKTKKNIKYEVPLPAPLSRDSHIQPAILLDWMSVSMKHLPTWPNN